MAGKKELSKDEVYLSDYILERLVQLGVGSVFGVPGDFNLTFLDVLEDHKTISWVGCCNELNAAYAADGYARVKRANDEQGLAALVTTFGVGELSAINGVAGAYSERVPVVHIVGAPSTQSQRQRYLLHHTLGNGAFNTFVHSAKGVTAFQAILDDAATATAQIDQALAVALAKSLPVYISLPTDLVYAPVKREGLDHSVASVSLPKESHVLPSGEVLEYNSDATIAIADRIAGLWEKSKDPVFLVDACAVRFGVAHIVRELVAKTKVRYFSTPMGKGALPEDEAQGFRGVYVGKCSLPQVKEDIESADLVITIGSLKSDFNTGEFSYKLKHDRVVELHSSFTTVNYAYYPGTSFKKVLPLLLEKLEAKQYIGSEKNKVGAEEEPGKLIAEEETVASSDAVVGVAQKRFWPLVEGFFEKNDIILAETGTSAFGMINTRIPEGAMYVSQVLWGSIGWTGGALLGALVAETESRVRRRTILFIGDGSFQLTIQEISTILNNDLKPIVFVLNNDGYTIERLINGPERVYNDISAWKWQETLSFFNQKGVPTQTWLAETEEELAGILGQDELKTPQKAHLIEVKMGRLDAPEILYKQAKLSAELNAA